MAINDFKIKKSHYGVIRFRTDDRDTSGDTSTIKEGDLLERDNADFVLEMLTGGPVQGTDIFMGISRSESTESATANGVIDGELVGPGTILEGTATTPGNISTDAELLALLLDYVVTERSAATSAGVLTIDEDAGDGPSTKGLMILDGDIVAGTLTVATCHTFWIGNV